MSKDKPVIPAQRGSAQNTVAKTSKVTKAFQPEYVNGSLQLEGPKNGRRGALSQYTKDLQVYVGALEKEALDLRDKQSKLDDKIVELNSTVTELERQNVVNSEKHQRELAAAKSDTRTANAAMDKERTRANIAEAHEDVRQQVHDLFDGAPLGNLAISRGVEYGSQAGASFYTCGGLYFAHSINSQRRSLTVRSASTNPIKLREYVITRFGGNDLLTADKTHLLFLREAATVEGYRHNTKRLGSTEMDRIYDLGATTKVFGCGHTAIEHVKLREKLLGTYNPPIVEMVFKRLESNSGTNDHDAELIRAIMIASGLSESLANELAQRQTRRGIEPNQAFSKGYDPETTRALSGIALSSMMDYDALDLRRFRHKPTSFGDALGHISQQSSPLLHDPMGLYGTIRPISREYPPKTSFSGDLYGENHLIFPKGETHNLGTDDLFTSDACVDGRATAKDIKPEHSGDCRNNGVTEGCPHESHQPKQS